MENTQTAQGLYTQFESARSPFLERAFECSELTLPALLPRNEGSTSSQDLPTPFQSIGARGVNNLASKMLLALFPPNTPCFRYSIDDKTLEELTQQEGMRAKVEEALASRERTVAAEIEGSYIRVGAFEAIKHLIVTGNVLVYLPDDGGMRYYPLNRYVVLRDAAGNVLHIITKDCVSPLTLPESVRESIGTADGKPEKSVDIFTHIRRGTDAWHVHQEVKGQQIPGTEGKYPLGKSAYLPLRWNKIDGESYGRGLVEQYLGDVQSVEGLNQAIVEAAAAAAKLVLLVNPNGTTDKREVAEAENGDVIEGNAQDVHALQLEKYADMRVALETAERMETRLSMAFLLNSSVQRQGERVTAEEIRFMAGELEDTLGGVYSIMSQEFQLPLINRIIYRLERQKRLNALPEKYVRPVIVTGMEALGRGHDLNKLNLFFQQLAPLGPEVIAKYMNVGDYITRVGTSLGIDMKGLVKSDEQVQQEAQQQQQAAMMQQGAQVGMDAMGKAAVERVKQGANNGNPPTESAG